MYILKFINAGEIRMGSPFNIAEVKLSGAFVPELINYDFQDKGCVNSTRDEVLLVQWAIEKNEPGFVIWKISEKNKTLKKSERIKGFCEKISYKNDNNIEIVTSIFELNSFFCDLGCRGGVV